jgi:hypothetical protein
VLGEASVTGFTTVVKESKAVDSRPRMSMFVVTFMANGSDTAKQTAYRTRSEAFRAADSLRATLAPRNGGRITVSDPDGRELQTWIEHDQGAHFTQPGGFRT